MDGERFARLTDRQRAMLRWVLLGKTSSEIGREMNVAPSTVDDQMKKAMAKLSVTSRAEAARRLAAFEVGLQRPDPQSPELRQAALFPLPWPVPTRNRPHNDLTGKHVLAWGLIIALGTPLLITVAALLIVTLHQILAGLGHN